MAISDYITCCKCDVKLIYDGGKDNNRQWWEERWGKEPEILCPDCERKLEPAPKTMPPELRKALEDYFDKCFRREPLAENVIGKLWDSTMQHTRSIDRLMAFTRAVEAAHGIKE